MIGDTSGANDPTAMPKAQYASQPSASIRHFVATTVARHDSGTGVNRQPGVFWCNVAGVMMRATGALPCRSLLALLLAAAVLAGCSGEYRPTVLPADVDKLYEVHPKAASPDADTVWIFEQGGPSHDISNDIVTLFLLLPDHEEIHLVQAHQTLTLNPRLAARHPRLSLDDLQAEVDVSVELLHRLVDHFKAQDKRVVVVGYSYGSWLVARYLAQHGPVSADRYVLMAGRLDMPREFVDGALLEGVLYHFPNATDPAPSGRTPTTAEEWIELRMAGATFHDRYTRRLAGTDLSTAIYAYATADTVVGRLSEPELRFLEESGATVIAGEGANHVSLAFNQDVIARIRDALEDGP
jgi:pimeloyl-ACP methyl ester carboxylesterase